MNELLEKITASVIDTDEGDSAELAQEALDQGIDVFAIVDALTAGTAGRKVAQYLLAHEGEGRVELDCSLTGLAGRLGVSRASLYRALDDLRDRGAIAHRGRTIRILDQTALEHL